MVEDEDEVSDFPTLTQSNELVGGKCFFLIRLSSSIAIGTAIW
jgi:hypothetical protein